MKASPRQAFEKTGESAPPLSTAIRRTVSAREREDASRIGAAVAEKGDGSVRSEIAGWIAGIKKFGRQDISK